MIFGKSNCTEETIGTIIKEIHPSIDLTRIRVQYKVDGETYVISDALRYIKEKNINLGKVRIGTSYKASLGEVHVGSKVRVLYNKLKPKRAYLPDNIGQVR